MTNEMVLNRTSSLVMPSYYVELDRDEMAYVEGGVNCYTVTSNFTSEALAIMALGASIVGTAHLVKCLGTGILSLTGATGVGLIVGTLTKILAGIAKFYGTSLVAAGIAAYNNYAQYNKPFTLVWHLWGFSVKGA